MKKQLGFSTADICLLSALFFAGFMLAGEVLSDKEVSATSKTEVVKTVSVETTTEEVIDNTISQSPEISVMANVEVESTPVIADVEPKKAEVPEVAIIKEVEPVQQVPEIPVAKEVKEDSQVLAKREEELNELLKPVAAAKRIK